MELFELPSLPYPFDALEPYIDAKTMEIHHGKHHRAYVDNLNKAIHSDTQLHGKSLEELLQKYSHIPAIKNNGGGHWNHSMFWNIMKAGENAPTEKMASALTSAFGTFEKFQEIFTQTALTRFGSGWAWLCVKNGTLEINSTVNQENHLIPNSGCQGVPILCLDVWEHAYYLKYQNKRIEYIQAFYKVINWTEVEKRMVEVR
ncbi:MAG: superoxide dismutase [Chitinophagaceae bacterium]|nr:superoxide dismutase [Chitinophagaceae bacterium]